MRLTEIEFVLPAEQQGEERPAAECPKMGKKGDRLNMGGVKI